MEKQLRAFKRSLRTVASVAVAAGAVLLSSEAAQAAPTCESLGFSKIVYVWGSSAIKPVISRLAYALAVAGDPLTLVYATPGSCVGVASTLQTTMSDPGQYWPADPQYDPDNNTSTATPAFCQPPAQLADVGASDVFPTSCPGIAASLLTGFYDFDPGFAQAGEFLISKSDSMSPKAISEEAAYLTFGFGASSTTEWSDPNRIFIRDEASGTMQMMSRAIGVPANKFIKAAGNANVTTATSDMLMRVAGSVGSIGYAFATDAELSAVVTPLAFQAVGQTCAYYPNSSSGTKDKARVRDGHYPIWGRFHMLAPVDSQNQPTNPDVARLLDIVTGKLTVGQINVLDLLIRASTIPLCAMTVTRDSEMGPLMSWMPPKSCGCYMDHGSGCQICQSDTDCTTERPKCNHWGATNDGYCEVQ